MTFEERRQNLSDPLDQFIKTSGDRMVHPEFIEHERLHSYDRSLAYKFLQGNLYANAVKLPAPGLYRPPFP